MKVLIYLITIQIISNFSFAATEFELLQPIRIPQIEAWKNSYSGAEAECRLVTEMVTTYVCLFPTQQSADNSLERAALWVEGNYGHVPHTVASADSQSVKRYVAGGHNRNDKDLFEFYLATTYACDQNPDDCLNREEIAFFNEVFFPLKEIVKDNFYILTFTPASYWKGVISHELWHAYFAENYQFTDVTLQFWMQLDTNTRNQIRQDVA